jgi:hypothetical protein
MEEAGQGVVGDLVLDLGDVRASEWEDRKLKKQKS